MRNAVPLLLILLAAGLGYWLVTAAEDDLPPIGAEPAIEPSPRAEPAPLDGAPLEAEGLTVKGTQPAPKHRPIVVLDPRTAPKGNLDVRILGPDLKPLDAGALQVYVDPVAGALWHTRQGLYDKLKQAWRFENVVAGAVRVRIQGDHVIGRTVDAVVQAGRDNDLPVALDRGGAIQYDVIAYDKTRPDPVRLTLVDYRGKPVVAWYEERSSSRMTTPKAFETAEIGPEGVVTRILPGRYRLRVVSPAEEGDEAEVDVVAGETAKVSLEVRR